LSGSVWLLRFDTSVEATRAYEEILSWAGIIQKSDGASGVRLSPVEVDTVGERSATREVSYILMNAVFTEVVFLRCGVVVQMELPTSMTTAGNYALQLDRRIQESVCD